MAVLGNLTFNIFTDANLTTAYSGITQIVHNTDLSDNDQDFVLYLGSTIVNRKIEATSNPGVDQVSITPTFALPEWQATTAYTVGQSVEPTTPNTFRYVVTIAGTSGGSEPTFPTVGFGTTVSDGTVTWELHSTVHVITEIKLATSSGGLGSATAGAALDIGTNVDSLVANKVEIHMRVTNSVTVVSNNVSNIELKMNLNEVVETPQ